MVHVAWPDICEVARAWVSSGVLSLYPEGLHLLCRIQHNDAWVIQVEVDLDMNAYANARAWHGDRKARTVKQQKTIEANKKALAVADKKVQIQLSKVCFTRHYSGIPTSVCHFRTSELFSRPALMWSIGRRALTRSWTIANNLLAHLAY